MLTYTAKILKITHSSLGDSPELTSPYRESKELPLTHYGVYIEAEIISVEGYGDYQEDSKIYRFFRAILPGFLRKLFRIYRSDKKRVKTSLMTTIGFHSFDSVKKFREQTDISIEPGSQDLATVKTLYRLEDLYVGELIKFTYTNPESDREDSDLNLIRYQNTPLTMEDFKNKSYPSRIDNTLEDSPMKNGVITFIGLAGFEKVAPLTWKGVWFRLQAKYPALLEIKQALFYRKRSRWQKIKIVIVVIFSVISITYALNPEFLNEPKHRAVFIIATVVNMIKEFF